MDILTRNIDFYLITMWQENLHSRRKGLSLKSSFVPLVPRLVYVGNGQIPVVGVNLILYGQKVC